MYLKGPLEDIENVVAWWRVRFRVLWCYMNSFCHRSNILCSSQRFLAWRVIILPFKGHLFHRSELSPVVV
jgi:hypothetical protein